MNTSTVMCSGSGCGGFYFENVSHLLVNGLAFTADSPFSYAGWGVAIMDSTAFVSVVNNSESIAGGVLLFGSDVTIMEVTCWANTAEEGEIVEATHLPPELQISIKGNCAVHGGRCNSCHHYRATLRSLYHTEAASLKACKQHPTNLQLRAETEVKRVQEKIKSMLRDGVHVDSDFHDLHYGKQQCYSLKLAPGIVISSSTLASLLHV